MEIEGGKRILTDYMEVDIIEIPKIYELKETDKNQLIILLLFDKKLLKSLIKKS